MKKHRSIGRSKSPIDTRPNKLSDHTSQPRTISRNQLAEARRSSQGGNPFNWKHLQSPINTSGERHNQSSKMFSVESKDFVKCSTKAGDCTSGSRPIIHDRNRTRINATSKKSSSNIHLVSLDSSQKTLKKPIIIKNAKHRELQTKERKKGNKNKDFILVGQDILAIQNSEQLEELLKKRKEQQESQRTQEMKDRSMEALQKYLTSYSDYCTFQQDRKQYHNALDIVLFHVKDMNSEEKKMLHDRLQRDVGVEETTNSAGQQGNKVDTVIKEVMNIIEKKQHLAKLVVNKIEQPNSQTANKKLVRIAQWKCKKLRQLMAAKTFLQNQRATIQHTSDPLRCLTQLLQSQFDQLTNQDNYQLLSRPTNKASAAESKRSNQVRQQRETFALENPDFLPTQLMQQIKRAKNIRDAIKNAMDMRVNQQLYEGVTFCQGIQTDLMAVNFYLARLTNYIRENYESLFLQNIKKCYGLNVQSKLKIVRDFDRTLMMEGEPPNPEILSNNIFVEFQQKVIGVGETQQDKNIKYYEHVHNKAIFDLFNYYLNSFRPFYQHGQPLPWRSNCQFISSFLITEDNLIDVMENARYSVLTTIESLCGLLVDEIPRSLLPQDLTKNEETLIRELLSEQITSVNNEKLKSVMNSQVNEVIRQMKVDVLKSSLEFFQTYMYSKLSQLIYQHLVRQAIDDIILI